MVVFVTATCDGLRTLREAPICDLQGEGMSIVDNNGDFRGNSVMKVERSVMPTWPMKLEVME